MPCFKEKAKLHAIRFNNKLTSEITKEAIYKLDKLFIDACC